MQASEVQSLAASAADALEERPRPELLGRLAREHVGRRGRFGRLHRRRGRLVGDPPIRCEVAAAVHGEHGVAIAGGRHSHAGAGRERAASVGDGEGLAGRIPEEIGNVDIILWTLPLPPSPVPPVLLLHKPRKFLITA